MGRTPRGRRQERRRAGHDIGGTVGAGKDPCIVPTTPTRAERRTRAGVFVTFALAHFVSTFVRSTNAVLADELALDVGLRAADLGLMTAVFFLAFAAAQLPLGSALDRWGARWVTPALMLAAVLGCALFAVAQSVAALAVGRALMGLGTAGILMGGLQTLAGWFSPRHFAAASGALVAVGSSGALLAATPLAWSAATIGWRATLGLAALALLATAIAVHRGARPAPARAHAPRAPRGGLARVFASPTSWRLMLLAAGTTGSVFALQSLWAGPYLARGLGLPPVPVGNVLLAFGSGVSIGYAALGALGARIGPARLLVATTAVFVALQLVLATGPAPGGGLLAVAFATLGVAGASSALIFSCARAAFPLELTGRAVTAVNLFMFVGGFAIQAGLGWWVQAQAASASAYVTLFLPTAAVAAVALVVFLPEARGRVTPPA